MLIENYNIKVISPPCDPGSERWSAFVSLGADIREVLPYLNAVWVGAIYDHKAKALTWHSGGHDLAIRPHEIAVGNVLDRDDAERVVKDLITEINDISARCAEIVPRTDKRQRPTAMALYRLLPKTNCKACGYLSCFTFALHLAAGSAEPRACPPLQRPECAGQYQELTATLLATKDNRAGETALSR